MESTLFRFAVGQSEGRHSVSWRLWSQGGDVYLLHRDFGNIKKFSFHNSGICRWAFIKPPRRGGDRATTKWMRKPIPPGGLMQGTLLLSIVIPTDHLSAGTVKKPRQLHWIKPAPPKHATVIEIFLTNEDEKAIKPAYASTSRALVFCGRMKTGANLCVSVHNVECELKKITSPGHPKVDGQVFGKMIIPGDDREYEGKPLRITMALPMSENDHALTIWELKAYEIEPLNS